MKAASKQILSHVPTFIKQSLLSKETQFMSYQLYYFSVSFFFYVLWSTLFMKDSLESDQTVFQRRNSITLHSKHQGARNSSKQIAAQAHFRTQASGTRCFRMLTTWSYGAGEYLTHISWISLIIPRCHVNSSTLNMSSNRPLESDTTKRLNDNKFATMTISRILFYFKRQKMLI